MAYICKNSQNQELIKLRSIIKGLKVGECLLNIIRLRVNLQDFRYTHNIYIYII